MKPMCPKCGAENLVVSWRGIEHTQVECLTRQRDQLVECLGLVVGEAGN